MKYGVLTVCFSSSVLNEGDVHGNSEDIADNEQRIKISDATLPYLEHLHKLLLDPPYVRDVSQLFFTGILFILYRYSTIFST